MSGGASPFFTAFTAMFGSDFQPAGSDVAPRSPRTPGG